MATAAQSNIEFRVLPLRNTELLALEALFDEQCNEWLTLLEWDYSGPSRLIREVSRTRELPGFSISSGSQTIGFAYYTMEPRRCSIGDVYIARPWRGVGADRAVMEALLDEIDSQGSSRRIESQCVSVDNDAADQVLQSRGFSRLDRHYMKVDLRNYEPANQGYRSGLAVRSWRDEDFAQAARVIYRSYRGEHDSLINSQYRTEEGCADLLSVLTDHIWCGDFLPHVSRVGLGPSGNIAAILIASRIGPAAGHLAQISVHPAHQNRGIGRRMIAESVAEFGRLNYHSVSLAVTATNTPARHLYESFGFRTIHQFPVYYREPVTG
jgi:ribosomal protein S18 acetylase RimI-like enzyme